MSAIQTAAALVQELGSGTVDDILADMEGYTRRQVCKALQNAKHQGLIDSDGHIPKRGVGAGKGAMPTTYRAIRKTQSRPAASVWHFAQLQAA